MEDDDARLAEKVARAHGRLDYVNVYREHTPHEWLVRKLLYQIEPFGEDRADLRAAVNTLRLVQMWASEPLTESQCEQEINNLRFYLKVNQPPEIVLTPAQAQAMHG